MTGVSAARLRGPVGGVIPRRAPLHALRAEAARLTAGAIGPVAVAGTQFAASMLLWNGGTAAEFGLFSFALLLIQLSFGLSNALVGTPLSVAPGDAEGARDRHACLSAHALYLAAVGVAMAALFWLSGAGWASAGFTALALAANLRWTARAFAIAREDVAASARSDGIYALTAAGSLAVAAQAEQLSMTATTACLIAANMVALAACSRDFLARQVEAVGRPALRRYASAIWPRQSRWALIGVVGTEASSNAHAYLVTWQFGAAVYAPLAFGSLFCRPLTIVLTALTQIDRPIFARHLRDGARTRVRGLMRMNLVTAGAAWLGNLVLALAIVGACAAPIAARGYDPGEVRAIVLLWFAIMALRAMRNPLSTYIQADRAFRPLALCSMASSLVSVVAVAGFTTLSPVHSLIGVLCGEALLLALVALLYRRLAR